MAAVSAQHPGIGNCTGRADNTQENIKQWDILLQEYCIPAWMSKLFLRRCRKWPRAFPCKYLKLLSNLLKASSTTKSYVPPAIPNNRMLKFPGSVKLTCPENQCHIMKRLENWKHKDLGNQGYIYG